MRAVLPLTNLCGIVSLAQAPELDLRAAIAAPEASPKVRDQDEDDARQRERNEQLNWFLTLLRTVAAAAIYEGAQAAPDPQTLQRATWRVVDDRGGQA